MRRSNTLLFEAAVFSENARGIGEIFLKLLNFLQIKPQVKCMINNYYGLHYTVITNRKEKEEKEVEDTNEISEYLLDGIK